MAGNMLNVCVFARSLPAHSLGGLEDHTLALAEGVAHKGHAVTIITTKHPKGLEHESRGKLRIYYLKGTITSKCGSSWKRESVKKFEELHSQKRFDIVHSQSGAGYHLLEANLGRKYGVPVVISLHGTVVDEIRTLINTHSGLGNPVGTFKALYGVLHNLFVLSSSQLFKIRRADAVIATSNEQKELIRKIFLLPRPKVFTVYNGIDEGLFRPRKGRAKILKKYGIGPGSKIMLAAARIEKEKGIQFCISALGALPKFGDAKLIIVGSGSYLPQLKRMALEAGLEKEVIFAGPVRQKELSDYFNACDVFLNPTLRQNGYDLTIIEAMSCGKPVIVSDIGSNPTAVEDGKDGVLVPIKNSSELANAIVAVLNNKKFAELLGKNARKKVLRLFTEKTMVLGTIRVYMSVLKKFRAKS